MFKTLGIESTCDETAASVVQGESEILSNVIYSQIATHKPWGGVVPEIASRHHVDKMLPVIQKALEDAKVSLDEIDLIAVAKGPGLIGSLLVGMNAAKGLSMATGIPLIGVNHIEAHLYAAMMTQKPLFPALGVILSGGHTTLLKIDGPGSYSLIGETVDDAIGEAFDKVAKMLELGYPGGPEVEKLAFMGDSSTFPFKGGKVKTNPLAFSFSGLKTAVKYTLEKVDATDQVKSDIAASFQRAAFEDVIGKCEKALKDFRLKSCIFGGGVTNSRTLRKMFTESMKQVPLFFPEFELTLDNAAMIAGLGHKIYQEQGVGDDWGLEPESRLPI
ncbi:MAG: tRNA (adenosine(37)-N6)-threonylcarbamoyltransferase complex transferase subunit TsaD [Chlamydiia bacterium]|nr:tRNA (adenosine(37)-N6)-threonylcarbamoyltransferase complex transferase subunit TsaD [Chlamydiia bacterium]